MEVVNDTTDDVVYEVDETPPDDQKLRLLLQNPFWQLYSAKPQVWAGRLRTQNGKHSLGLIQGSEWWVRFYIWGNLAILKTTEKVDAGKIATLKKQGGQYWIEVT